MALAVHAPAADRRAEPDTRDEKMIAVVGVMIF
jgi:hypothetical protein